jgi:hypothetical protein
MEFAATITKSLLTHGRANGIRGYSYKVHLRGLFTAHCSLPTVYFLLI